MIVAAACLVLACSFIGSWMAWNRNTRKAHMMSIACNTVLIALFVAWCVYAVTAGLER